MEIVVNAQLLSLGATYRNAGLSRYLLSLLRGFAEIEAEVERAHRVTALVPASVVSEARRLLGAETPSPRLLPTHTPTSSPALRAAWEQAILPRLARHADVLHGPALGLPPRAPCPMVVTIHDLASWRYPAYFRPARRLYQAATVRASLRAATRIAAISESTRHELTALLGIPASRVTVIPPAIESDFRPCDDPARLAAFRAAHGLPNDYIFSLGTLEPRKNLAGLLDAYARLRALWPETPPLVVAGARGWYDEALRQRVRALGIERAVLFAGYVAREEQPLWYAAARLFVYPSHYEGFGLPIVEALACGTPVITSDRPGTRDAAGHVAMRVDPSDVGGLAHAMRQVLADDAMQRRMAAEGPAWARHFTCRRQALAYLTLYEEARADEGRRPEVESGRRDGHGSRRVRSDGFSDSLDPNLPGHLRMGSRAGAAHRAGARH